MGIHTWAYEPEKCDGEPCICNCDHCPKAKESENIPFWAVYQAVLERQSPETKTNEPVTKT